MEIDRGYILIISSLQVISDVMSPLFLAFMFLRTEYYPLSELFGDWFCYFFDYTIAICGFTGQFHSFFLASFRYICLFHDGFMFKYNISPKVIFLLKLKSLAEAICFSKMEFRLKKSRNISKTYAITILQKIPTRIPDAKQVVSAIETFRGRLSLLTLSKIVI